MNPILALLPPPSALLQEAGAAAQEGGNPPPPPEMPESASQFLSPDFWRDLLSWAGDRLLEWLPNVLAALAIFFIGRWVVRRIANLVRRLLTRAGMDATLVGFLGNLVNMGLFALVILAAVERLGVDTTSFAAILAAAGLAVGFALQGSLANFASGVMLMIFRPFRVGDFVEAGGVSGAVLEIQIFSTILKTPDNKKIIVPNSAITGGNIINYSAMPTRRVDLVFGVGYEDDLQVAKNTLKKLLEEDQRVLRDPAPVVAVSELADSSVNFVVRPWVKSEDYWDVYWDLTEKGKLALEAAGCSIPFPQRDVHLHQVPAA